MLGVWLVAWKLALGFLSGKMRLLQAGWGERGHSVLATVLGDAPTSNRDELSCTISPHTLAKGTRFGQEEVKGVVHETDISFQASGMECKIHMAIRLFLPLSKGSRPQ